MTQKEMQPEKNIKLISLNIEGDRHMDTVIPFLLRECPDVLCLQEVFEKDIPVIEKALEMKGAFAAITIPDLILKDGVLVIDEDRAKQGPQGVALFARAPSLYVRPDYYFGTPTDVPRRSVGYNRIFLSADIEKDGVHYIVGNTHFTWTPDGQASEEQHRDLKELFKILEQFPEIVFCGDFNAPRGREIWEEIAKKYRDNIPMKYQTSLDQKLHQVKGLQYVVDGLFSTPEYWCTETKLIDGVSDHMAIVSHIERIPPYS